jgi:5-methylcytosine-specific restriction endonuclease McrA
MPSRYDKAKHKELAEAAQWKQVCKVVDRRDKRRCRACGHSADPNAIGITQRGERHHIVYRSAGGVDASYNVALLCAACHNEEHRHQLRIEGNADERLDIWRRDSDEWYLARRELAPYVIEKD